jgi:hypothetical protein
MLNIGFVWLSKVQKLGFCGSMVSENTWEMFKAFARKKLTAYLNKQGTNINCGHASGTID